MSTVKRDKSPKGEGKAPAFQIRMQPEFKKQLSELAKNEGMSLGNWFKELARKELQSQGIEPKG
ncbi:toxin-antitoxin system HicB family antitoxin [Xenorhabdus griffiniae]|uniref:toxin-antitoxin system HicB family antitoxin n=1 Tax=Xenorhabdus TaxID=626 RepID=UPI000C048096|nr:MULTISPECIES: toxin-antitoxin system HicB family antitoxin [Xenorhabdus]MCC8382007.1 toxin-antitoxin system HicB family antitoxin [Xenorhabdus sp. PB30.3]MDC9605545.1 toxin-antitoxin system HicB family antitoxin [Xenorhabdus griffiniae]PHM69310.1 repressor [Xenorhabdus sp. KJ12.1]